MKVSCENNIVTVDGVNDFTLSQILECGQCFHFDKLDEEVYEVVAFGRAVKMEQTDKVLRIYGSSMEDYEGIWKLYLDMDNDYGLIKQSVIKADGALKTAVDEKSGIHILNQDFFETLISFIVSQNKSIPQIKQCVKNISHRFGDEVIGYNGEAFYVFPDVQRLHDATEEELRECKVGFRAPYIKNATEAVYSGAVTKEKLDELDIAQARELLMTIKGVGEKVANCVLLFGLGRREAFPVDVWMKRIMEQMYFDGKDTKKQDIEAFAVNKFGDLGGYAQQYLFDYARTTLFK
ncbi:DNA-3-methyladenine glycosylase family protein [Coprococcus eutactus]|jgi:N-glycosylase/DNA lyase|uniref:DNA-(apurinic or apyrimidinic site) lyase n=1 Tax=Coprococcus eutactus TaxID=33043 RepID=A0A3R6CUC6_9FIRM|nr:DNA-3-methyladenine glycosylase [Coprococcus eutactus]MCB6628752.1 DNA-3-methyladenine glycosylase [Coprococcus eutactus]MCG4788937.1 DNA-3-methyladenine glycosylase [Coprococcus eutactus]MCQ5118599.1 DNA-3-methyladenine glycosylase [Coprococcus eutactus]MCQ5131553.1 DNA-3-methyladenine glycosylase [Coprococcus eutactus]MCQ5135790.1 DNA-3-methyladenine glycosylase [Coprococcus eutactus]